MGLVAGGVDIGDGVGQEVAVDVRTEVRLRRSGFDGEAFEDVVGGELAKVG
jgi:hypothetical protein